MARHLDDIDAADMVKAGRGLSHVDEAVDAAKAVRYADEVADAAGMGRYADELADAGRLRNLDNFTGGNQAAKQGDELREALTSSSKRGSLSKRTKAAQAWAEAGADTNNPAIRRAINKGRGPIRGGSGAPSRGPNELLPRNNLRPDRTAEERAQSVEEYMRLRGDFTEKQISDTVNKVRNYELPEDHLGEWIEKRHGVKKDEFNCIGAVLCDLREVEGRSPLSSRNTSLDKNPLDKDLYNETDPADYILIDSTYQKLNNNFDQIKTFDGIDVPPKVTPGQLNNLRPGDIIAFEDVNVKGFVEHLGVYAGDGLIYSKLDREKSAWHKSVLH